MNISLNTTIGEIVRLNFQTARLFQANQIDYCCGGSQTVSEVCNDSGIEPLQFIQELEKVVLQSDPDTEYINNLDLDELSKYIVNRHHTYVRNNIPFLLANLEKLCRVHGERHQELFQIRDLFHGAAGELTMHMQKEELILFPYVGRMIRARNDNSGFAEPTFGEVSNPIMTMIKEHENEGRRFEKISELSRDYEIPPDACTTYEVTLNQLRDFENDLHRHIHLENNILFPGAVELENGLLKKI